jgi:hypothetical protein
MRELRSSLRSAEIQLRHVRWKLISCCDPSDRRSESRKAGISNWVSRRGRNCHEGPEMPGEDRQRWSGVVITSTKKGPTFTGNAVTTHVYIRTENVTISVCL